MNLRRSSRRAKGKTDFEDIAWLNAVREVRYPLDLNHPIFIREVSIETSSGQAEPTVPHPERHPCCELNIILNGQATQYVGGEKILRNGDVMMLGPDMPHYAYRLSAPFRTVTIYFLPLVLFQMGPNGGGSEILARFTEDQSINRRVVTPSSASARLINRNVETMLKEWQQRALGFELKLWTNLIEILVDMMRWEKSLGKGPDNPVSLHEWKTVEKALRYIHDHFVEPIYIEQIAVETGMHPTRLRMIFRRALGTTCAHYIQSLRIAQAKSLLCEPDARVADVAFAVGFETLSNFNNAFRNLVGLSPSEYVRNFRSVSS